MKVPEGFSVTLFAGEPEVRQPIGFCIDDRGRLWVAEAYAYPNHSDEPGRDRIVILEDTTGDGRHDKRTIFYDKLNYVTGIEVGFGGAWVMSPPYFYFIPDADGDDVPDGPPQVILDGFGNHANSHNLANGFAWGPDGWLYGTHGRTNWSMIGKPGTPESERVRFDGGVWRYHPIRDVWEPFADGTTNPWGIDWDDWGEAFVCNCVNPHLFHVIQGAHYEPWRNRESSRHAYQRIETIADHLHFVGQHNVRDGYGSEEEHAAGGGHAHSGTMVYLGDNWPEKYRNTVFMNNIHGKRINNDILKRSGSGYVASHGPDLMLSRDPGYMGITLAYGPDGGVFVSDWSDTGQCHTRRNTQRHNGRIFKVVYVGEGDREQGGRGDGATGGRGESSKRTGLDDFNTHPSTLNAQPFDVSQFSDEELVQLQLHPNDWWVRHARRVLQERYGRASSDEADLEALPAVHDALHEMFSNHPDVTRQLRALWALHVTGGLDQPFLIRQLDHKSEFIRAWAVRLLCEPVMHGFHDEASTAAEGVPQRALERFRELAATGDSQRVRLHLTSALQRLTPEQRWPIAEALVRRQEDREDQNLPLMLWYGIEPLVEEDLPRFIGLAEEAEIPLIRWHVPRRVLALDSFEDGLNALVLLLTRTPDPEARGDLLAGILQGLEGRRTVPMPPAWPDAYAVLSTSEREAVRKRALRLALIFDDRLALNELMEQARDRSSDPERRIEAVETLVARKVSDLPSLLLELLEEPELRLAALRGLAEYDHPETAPRILAQYEHMDARQRQQALGTLSSRSDWGAALLDAIEEDQVPRSDLTAYTARQLRSLGEKEIIARVNTLWGEVRETAAEKREIIEGYQKRFTPDVIAQGDRSAGRASFQKLCANCHRLFGTGGEIGPDITGSQRTNLDYLLENLVDPSASVAKDYQMEVIQTVSGRVITGLVVEESAAALTVQTVNEKVLVPAGEVEARKLSTVSMMPDGLLSDLSLWEVRDLIAYLSGNQQAPLPSE
jgi:putative membrane-bound dehydrogenase-like protein